MSKVRFDQRDLYRADVVITDYSDTADDSSLSDISSTSTTTPPPSLCGHRYSSASTQPPPSNILERKLLKHQEYMQQEKLKEQKQQQQYDEPDYQKVLTGQAKTGATAAPLLDTKISSSKMPASPKQPSKTSIAGMMKWKYPTHNSFIVDMNNEPLYMNAMREDALKAAEKEKKEPEKKTETAQTPKCETEIYYTTMSPLNPNNKGSSSQRSHGANKRSGDGPSSWSDLIKKWAPLALVVLVIIIFAAVILSQLSQLQESIREIKLEQKRSHQNLMEKVTKEISSMAAPTVKPSYNIHEVTVNDTTFRR